MFLITPLQKVQSGYYLSNIKSPLNSFDLTAEMKNYEFKMYPEYTEMIFNDVLIICYKCSLVQRNKKYFPVSQGNFYLLKT